MYTLIIIAVIPIILLAVTNSIIFGHARRSTQRIQPTNRDNAAAPAPALSNRDIHLLKHMVFMFVVFFCGWIPIYIIAVVDFNGTGISYVLFHVILIIPAVSLLIDVVNLFLYNHELRKYLSGRQLNGGVSQTN